MPRWQPAPHGTARRPPRPPWGASCRFSQKPLQSRPNSRNPSHILQQLPRRAEPRDSPGAHSPHFLLLGTWNVPPGCAGPGFCLFLKLLLHWSRTRCSVFEPLLRLTLNLSSVSLVVKPRWVRPSGICSFLPGTYSIRFGKTCLGN